MTTLEKWKLTYNKIKGPRAYLHDVTERVKRYKQRLTYWDHKRNDRRKVLLKKVARYLAGSKKRLVIVDNKAG